MDDAREVGPAPERIPGALPDGERVVRKADALAVAGLACGERARRSSTAELIRQSETESMGRRLSSLRRLDSLRPFR